MSRGNPRLKKANSQSEFDEFRISELARCSEDPIYFAENYVKIVHPTKGEIPLVLWDFQKQMILNYKNNRYSITLASRQVGKSTIAVVYLLWLAMFRESQTILIASNKRAGAQEMIGKIRFAYEAMPEWLKPGVAPEDWNKESLSFDNKSRIVSTATSPDSGRGMSISCLYLDEFAFVAPNIQEEFWASITPTLSTGGSCIITSTPNGATNLFAQIWRSAEAGVSGDGFEFLPLRVRWDEPPGRDETFKESQIAIIGEHIWRQEFECEFLSSNSLLIDSITIENLKRQHMTDPEFRLKEVDFFEHIKGNTTYIMGIDPATGTGRDSTTITVLKFPEMEEVAHYRSSTTVTSEVYGIIKAIINLFERVGSTIYFSIENNGVGEGLLSLYDYDEYAPEFAELISQRNARGKVIRPGINVTGASKNKTCLKMEQMLKENKLIMHSEIFYKELETFVRVGNSIKAEVGGTDDVISSVLICLRVLEEMAHYDDDAWNKVYAYDDINLMDDHKEEEIDDFVFLI